MKKIIFSLPIEALGEATEAYLLGDFNNWILDNAPKLVLQEDGTLKAEVLLDAGQTYEYRFLLNNGTWVNDWAAENYVYKHEIGIENSVITVPAEVLIVEEIIKAPKKEKTTKGKATKAKKAVEKPTEPLVDAKDDLTKIEGIGPKIVKLLQAEGINTFKQLAGTTSKTLKAILEAAGPKFNIHEPGTWPKQAKLAAADKWEKLLELQDKLKGGK
jgi:predicted flap endonuclease-1-like 5' DNA nuclease